jgi:hypothetical protein|tara:strand:- start:429 stop:944 length:516 start_codon:yes stop_codon:yes gene_type:complete
MKDLELRDLIPQKPSPLVSLALYIGGRWQFGSVVESDAIPDDGQNIYKVSVKFSLVAQNQNDPSRGTLFGEPGDYFGIDRLGQLSLITQEQFEYRFPKKRKPGYSADNSEKLRNKNYITEIVRGSAPVTSNTTPITISAPSTSRTSVIAPDSYSGGSTGGSTGGGGGGGGY